MKYIASLIALCTMSLYVNAAEETPPALKVLAARAIYVHLGLDSTNAAAVSGCMGGLHGIKGKDDKGLHMLYAGIPYPGSGMRICETVIAKKKDIPTATVLWCDSVAPESGAVTNSFSVKAVQSAILQLMKDLPREQLPQSHPVVTAIKETAAPKEQPAAHQYIVAVEERDMLRAETMSVVVDVSGKVLEMRILRSIP